MRINVDFDRCSGNGLCMSIAPDYFNLDQQGQLHIRKVDVDNDDIETIEHAIQTCPVEAIGLEP